MKSTGFSCREESESEKHLGITVEEDIDRKSEEMFLSLYGKVGREIPEDEFNDWSEYLHRLRNNVKTESASIEDLDTFLKYTEQMYGELKIEK